MLRSLRSGAIFILCSSKDEKKHPQAKRTIKKPLFIPIHKKVFFIVSGEGRGCGNQNEALLRERRTRNEDGEKQ